MNNINLKKGTHTSELEASLIVLRKLVNSKLDSNPNLGVTLGKGQPGETRIRYKSILSVIDSLETKFGLQGCFSFGICKTCDLYSTAAHGSDHMGTCSIKGVVHEYDSCSKHSKEKGGFGL